MFTGIIEELGEVTDIQQEGTNLNFTIKAHFTNELKIDQSVAHNGVCLTVVSINQDLKHYTVNIIKESLDKSNFKSLQIGDIINLERAAKIDSRLDGHMVQGHVDQVGKCHNIIEEDGSWIFKFTFNPDDNSIIVKKGSITVNGTSLTVKDCSENWFEVAIIPYTYEHTNFKSIDINDTVNLEFDVIGKYLLKYAKPYLKA